MCSLKFSSIAWNFINTIYKSRWNNLTVNGKNKTFQQCIYFQFNKNRTTTLEITEDKKTDKSKQADIFRIPLPISSRPSKSILAKSKYYKKTQSSNLKA